MELIRSFNILPDEIIQQVLLYLQPDTTSIVQHASRRLYRLANEPLLWRDYCLSSFKYWDSKHRIRQKLAGNVADTDWKKIYFYRRDVDRQTTQALDGILNQQMKRIEKSERIGCFGYDAKDTLLRHCVADEGYEDFLARRYYANALLDHVHRSQALDEWWKMSNGHNVPLERALGAFDLFVLHDENGDLQEISDIFDKLTVRLCAENPDIDDFSPREKTLAIVRFLRQNNLTGIDSESQYHDLQNNYIGIALQDPNHPSVPLVSVAIFCAVAQRLGLKAFCCAFPNHSHAVIHLSEGEVLDGDLPAEAVGVRCLLYLDPYRSEDEIPVEHLRTRLAAWGIKNADCHKYLAGVSTRSVVLRTSRNILATVHNFRSLDLNTNGHPTIRLHGNPFADMDDAFYSALWANFMFCNPSTREDPDEGVQFLLPMILERVERLFPMDVNLIERYICPAFRNVSADQRELYETLRFMRAGDSMPKQIRSRASSRSIDRVKYQVGQLFQHKRYGYTAAIIGWDLECTMHSEWIAHNQIDRLDRGRHQSFYHALVEDTSIRYVAEDNVRIIQPDEPISLMSLAGRYFKRWDSQIHRFISNVKDEYPDD